MDFGCSPPQHADSSCGWGQVGEQSAIRSVGLIACYRTLCMCLMSIRQQLCDSGCMVILPCNTKELCKKTIQMWFKHMIILP